MMHNPILSPYAATLQKTEHWLSDLMRELGVDDPRQANRILCTVLQALRDRLTITEVAQLGAQLPPLVRGFYYEGFRPTEVPQKMDRAAFLERIAERLQPPDGGPERAARSVFNVMRRHVTAGEIRDIEQLLPAELAELWRTAA